MFAVFLDRDGVINVDTDYLCDIDDLVFESRVIEALIRISKELPSETCKIIVVTNQSGVARGLFSLEQCERFAQQFLEAVASASRGEARIDDYLFCPHHPTEGVAPYRVECECRKPKPGLLMRAQSAHQFDLSASFMIGDQDRDIRAGQAAGCYTVLIRPGVTNVDKTATHTTADAISADLFDATTLIIQEVNKRNLNPDS
jgi:D-glycero-D-manno-heptose 1,7-bisphosphate phosphatase